MRGWRGTEDIIKSDKFDLNKELQKMGVNTSAEAFTAYSDAPGFIYFASDNSAGMICNVGEGYTITAGTVKGTEVKYQTFAYPNEGSAFEIEVDELAKQGVKSANEKCGQENSKISCALENENTRTSRNGNEVGVANLKEIQADEE